MKEIIIILLILLIIFTGAIYSKKYLMSSSNELIKELESLKEVIKADTENINKEKASSMSEEICSKWNKINDKWCIIVLHSELDLIETALIETKASIESSEFEEANKKIDVSIFLLNHINQKEKFSLKNIF